MVTLALSGFMVASQPSQQTSTTGFSNLPTVTMSGTFGTYGLSAKLLNTSTVITNGLAETLLFNVSSPVGGTFYIALGSPGLSFGPGAIVKGYHIPLPNSTSLSFPQGQIFSHAFEPITPSFVIVPVILTHTGTKSGPLTITLYAFQHQNSGPGIYEEDAFTFTFQVA
jgi:hypothetical protein